MIEQRKALALVILAGGVVLIFAGQSQASPSGKFGGKVAGGSPSIQKPAILDGRPVGKGIAAINSDVEDMARTLWGEAAGEGRHGMELVAAVILNRVRAQAWYGATVQAVIFYPAQFEVWNVGHPRGTQARAVTTDNAAFQTALDISQRALSGQLGETARGATHYIRVGHPASWRSSPIMRFLFTAGNHDFYKEELAA